MDKSRLKKPSWIRQNIPGGPVYAGLKNIINNGMVYIYHRKVWFWFNERINRSIKYTIKGLDSLVREQEEGNGDSDEQQEQNQKTSSRSKS